MTNAFPRTHAETASGAGISLRPPDPELWLSWGCPRPGSGDREVTGPLMSPTPPTIPWELPQETRSFFFPLPHFQAGGALQPQAWSWGCPGDQGGLQAQTPTYLFGSGRFCLRFCTGAWGAQRLSEGHLWKEEGLFLCSETFQVETGLDGVICMEDSRSEAPIQGATADGGPPFQHSGTLTQPAELDLAKGPSAGEVTCPRSRGIRGGQVWKQTQVLGLLLKALAVPFSQAPRPEQRVHLWGSVGPSLSSCCNTAGAGG